MAEFWSQRANELNLDCKNCQQQLPSDFGLSNYYIPIITVGLANKQTYDNDVVFEQLCSSECTPSLTILIAYTQGGGENVSHT